MALSASDVWKYIDSLTKPPRSLGRLEELAMRLCMIQQTLSPRTNPRRLILFAGDHGVVSAGVSAWPTEITALMIRTICSGKAASTIFARENNAETVVVNVGVRDEFGGDSEPLQTHASIQYRDSRVRAGTRNLATEPALTAREFMQAIEIGGQEAQAAAQHGNKVVVVGEMGIGNTTPAACLAMLLADIAVTDAVGRGAGADDATMERKREVVQTAVSRSREIWPTDPIAAIAGIAGLEIAAIAGFLMAAHSSRLTIVLDGYVTGAAALIAEHLQPGTTASMIAAHRSAERGHGFMLEHLGLHPFLDWNLRLGEGTGALLLLPLLDAAARMTGDMATLESLGVPAT